jgi:AAA15 family ATPase/GTPase
MTLPFMTEKPSNLTEKLSSSNERFAKLCNKFDSARHLADELALAGYEISESKATRWRNRQFKRVYYCDVQAVKYAFQKMKLKQSHEWAEALREAQEL